MKMLKKIFEKLRKKKQKNQQPVNISKIIKEVNKFEIKKDNEKSNDINLKIITSYDSNFKDIGDITHKSIFQYSKKFNLKFEKLEMPNTGRPKSWNKIKLLHQEIKKEESEFIMWIDADAFFHKDAKNILYELDKNHEIFLVNHYCSVHKGSRFKNTILTINRINCGIMIFKVSQFNLDFLEKVWNMDKYKNHVWWEQAAIMDIIGLRAEITNNLNDNIGDDTYLKKIRFLSREWNSIPSDNDISNECLNPSIVHLAGINNLERIKILNDFIDNKKMLN